MKTQKWGDIAYHYIIGPSGNIYECRNYKYKGDTGTEYDTNGHILVCLLGNFNKEKPSSKALDSLAKFVALKLKEFSLNPEDVKMHCEVASTDCPGKKLKEWLKKEGMETIKIKWQSFSK